MGQITTVLGDISPEELGYTTIHEHPFMRADSDGVLPLPEDAILPQKSCNPACIGKCIFLRNMDGSVGKVRRKSRETQTGV